MNLFKTKNKSEKKVKNTTFTLSTSNVPSEAFNVTEKDFISPTLIKETTPKDITDEGVEIGDYFVEIGGTVENKRYYRTLYVELTGGNTYAGMLDKLYTGDFGQGNLEADIDFALHVIPVETSTELDKINSRIRAIKSDMYRKMPDEKRIKLEDELGDLEVQQKRLRLNIEKAFRASIQIILSSNDLDTLKRFTNIITRRLAGSQIIVRAADGKQLDAFLNLLPVKDESTYAEHTYPYETSNLADMFMFGNGKISHSFGIVWGIDHMGRPIIYNGWDRSLMNRNFIITGTSGGGKTFAALKLIHHDVLRGIRHAIICPKGDYRRYVEAMGCPYFDFGLQSNKRINFFDVDIEEPLINGVPTPMVNLESTIAAASAIVFKMIRVYDNTLLNGIAKRRIEDAIRNLYNEKEITRDPNSLFDDTNVATSFSMERPRKKMPQLSELQLNLEKDERLKDVAEILKGFTKEHGTPERAIFDCQSNVNINDVPILAFGLAELDIEIMKPIGLFISTKWLATKFSHKNREIQKRVVVDEAQVIMEDNETAQWLENEFRIVRFFNTSMGAITQGFEVFARSEHGLGIMKNAPTKLFLKQDNIDETQLQEKFNLTGNEVDFLTKRAKEGLGILRVNEERSIIKVTGTPLEEYLFETDPNKLEQKRAAYEAYKANKAKKAI
ncbi:VirB4 family type IV secretion system protein [Lysinibacillus sphaericus]|uniref:VirB4 family type IV secretion system protein n=1 Tax=Lysinibacillus sphaericus TaxID=1421 RepID=UPI003F7A3D1B